MSKKEKTQLLDENGNIPATPKAVKAAKSRAKAEQKTVKNDAKIEKKAIKADKKLTKKTAKADEKQAKKNDKLAKKYAKKQDVTYDEALAVVEAEVASQKAEKELNGEQTAELKLLVIRCVTAVLCVAVLCGGAATCAAKYKDSVTSQTQVSDTAADDTAADSLGGDTSSSASGTDASASGTDATASDTGTDASASGSDATASGSSSSSGAGSSSSSSQASGSSSQASGTMTTAQIVSLFNTAANKAKTGAKSIQVVYTGTNQVGEASIGNSSTLKRIANKLISSNVGENKKGEKTYTSAADKKAHFPVSGQAWSSKLTASDLKSATATESGGVYTITLNVKDDTTPNAVAGTGHIGKCGNLITKQSIVDGAGSAGMAVIKEDSIKVTYKDTQIVATVNKSTGKLITANYVTTWKLALNALGMDVSLVMKSTDKYKIAW